MTGVTALIEVSLDSTEQYEKDNPTHYCGVLEHKIEGRLLYALEVITNEVASLLEKENLQLTHRIIKVRR